MFRFLILWTMYWTANALCSISHQQVWACIVKDTCMNKFQLHSSIRSKTKSLRRQFLMAVEGSKYHRLFEDFDADHNGCLSMHDITAAGSNCQRSCMWRQTMHDLLC